MEVSDQGQAQGAAQELIGEELLAPVAEALRTDSPARHARPRRGRLTGALVIWDALIPVALLALAATLEGAIPTQVNSQAAQPTDGIVLLLAVLSPIGLAIAGGYNQRRRRGGSRLVFAMRLLVVGIAVSWVCIVVSAAAEWPVDLAQLTALSVLLPCGWLVGRWACDRHPSTAAERVLLVGSGQVADRVVALTARHRESRLDVVGRVDDGDSTDVGTTPLLGHVDRIAEIAEDHGVDRVLVAFAPSRDSHLVDGLRRCVAAGVEVDVVPRFFDLVGPAPRAHTLGSLALLEVPARGLTPAQRALKRTVDLVGALILVTLLLPVIGVIAAAIALFDGRPVFFRQTRIGKGGRPFRIVKFRTMFGGGGLPEGDPTGVGDIATRADAGLADAAEAGSISTVVREVKLTEGGRVTALGRFLRSTSLDELPQLYNVLRGDMSLVGPRPLRPFEVAALSPWQLARQDLRPGLTGLWQVLGRSEIDWEERIQLDYSYVAHWSILSDLRILARTVPAVAGRSGAE